MKVMLQTNLPEVIIELLACCYQQKEQFHYMNLEILWILCNLACVEDCHLINLIQDRSITQPCEEMSQVID